MKTTVSFYSTPEELQDWLSRWVTLFSLGVVGCSFYPAKRVLLPRDAPVDYSTYNETVLGFDHHELAEFCTDPKSSDYPPGFRVVPPKMTGEGLRSGSLNLIRKEPLNLDVWKALVAAVTKQTTAGMWVQIKFNGRNAFDKHLRYTPGIADLTRQGLKLLPFAGGNPVTIDEPQHDNSTRAER